MGTVALQVHCILLGRTYMSPESRQLRGMQLAEVS